MSTRSKLIRIAATLLAACLLAVFSACGNSGSNEPPDDEEESTFPEPPGRPSAQQADTSGAVPLRP